MKEELEAGVLPQIPGISAEGAKLVRWLKKDGDSVSPGQAVALVETCDGWIEMPVTVPGVLRHAVEASASVSIGEVLFRVEADPTIWPPTPRKSL